MSKSKRFNRSTGSIAALAAGVALLAAAQGASAAGAVGSYSGPGKGDAANGSTTNSVRNTTPISTCWACRFVKRDGSDKLDRSHKSDRDKSDHDDKHVGHPIIIYQRIGDAKPAPGD